MNRKGQCPEVGSKLGLLGERGGGQWACGARAGTERGGRAGPEPSRGRKTEPVRVVLQKPDFIPTASENH